jgi:NhaP-type Na+/H+ or K+/H+ antiporter
MPFTLWYILIGFLLIAMALAGSHIKRLPLTTTILYLLTGILLGPHVLGLINLNPLAAAHLLERFSELAVIISLFAAGLKLTTPFSHRRWWFPIRLAFFSMIVTVGLITLIGVYLLGLPLGAAILLGAVIAPTDPVLASDVQVEHPWDKDSLRFSLTGEAGLNDGTAFPFVMLGLGLLGLHDLGTGGLRWWGVDVFWSIAGGLAIGGLCGTGVGRLIVYLRRKNRETVGLDDYLSLGLLAASYGLALWIHTYGFLAVFAAGLALRRIESASAPPMEPPDPSGEVPKVDPEDIPAHMAQAVLGFNQQLERIAEVALVLLIGGMLTTEFLPHQALWFVPLVLLVVRPVAVCLGLLGQPLPASQLTLTAWFGIRGIGSIYYLTYAITHGLTEAHAHLLTALTLTLIATSIILHGTSVTPLMTLYQKFGPTKK